MLGVVLILWLVAWEPTYSKGSIGIEFGSVADYFSGVNVDYIEEDKYEEGSFLISTGRGIGSLNKDKNFTMIAGSRDSTLSIDYSEGVGIKAMFGSIASFAQLNKSMLIVVDGTNKCLRAVYRSKSLPTERLTKRCDPRQNRVATNGAFSEATFPSPQMLIRGRSDEEYYLTDYLDESIRLVDPVSRNVYPFLNKEVAGWGKLNPPLAVAFDDEVTLYVATFINIYKIDVSSKSSKGLTKGERGEADGELRKSQFHPSKGLALIADRFLVAVTGTNYTFRLIDLDSKWVTTENSLSANGNPLCVVNIPDQEALYFGGPFGIKRLPYHITSSSARLTAGYIALLLLLLPLLRSYIGF